MGGDKMFDEFGKILENRHEHIKDLKYSKDKRVFGYLCSYVPEALLFSAGATLLESLIVTSL